MAAKAPASRPASDGGNTKGSVSREPSGPNGCRPCEVDARNASRARRRGAPGGGLSRCCPKMSSRSTVGKHLVLRTTSVCTGQDSHKPVDAGLGDSLGRHEPVAWGGAQRRGRHKSSQSFSDKERGPLRIGVLPGLVVRIEACGLTPRCRRQRCRRCVGCRRSALPTILGDVVVNAADDPRRCRRQCCRPSSELSSSPLPTLLGDAVVIAADLTRRCRRHRCRPYSEMSSSLLPTFLEDAVVAAVDPTGGALVAVAEHRGVPSEARP